MSGGIAYVLDEDGTFESRCNLCDGRSRAGALPKREQEAKLPRELWHLGQSDEAILRALVEKHARYTGSARAREILDDWAEFRTQFVKVFPKEYRRALAELAASQKRIAA